MTLWGWVENNDNNNDNDNNSDDDKNNSDNDNSSDNDDDKNAGLLWLHSRLGG
jgi:hypothetical protein